MDVLIPSAELASAFTQIAKPLYDKRTQNIEQSHTLAALRDALLPKLLSGEVMVKDVEKIL